MPAKPAILRHFEDYETDGSLTPDAQLLRVCFHIAAQAMFDVLPFGAERSAGFRKLLEARDCAFRAELEKD
ncbi:hypothetical protein AB0C11_40445 [Streptomyces sp. NPDC039016]|uniref:hypothetical protein n=1 Tax=Streptomyces sp. NPDC039016 TaxID=3154330 RepID=UPI0033C9B3E1